MEVISSHLLCSLVLPLLVHIATTLGSLFRLWVHQTVGSGMRKLVVAAASNSRLISRSADGLMTSNSSSGGGGEFGDGRTTWHGSIDLIIAAPVEKVWAIGSDWLQFPRRCAVECTEGQSGVPGCVRKVRPHDCSGKYWAAEKLVHIDHHRHTMAYDLVDGNIGIEPGYQAVFQAFGEGPGKTRVVWPFRFSPTQNSVDSFTPLIMAKFTGYVKELEAIAQK